MPFQIDVKGEGSASRMATVAKISITFRSEALYRNEASTTLFKALEQLIDVLKVISPSSDSGHSVFQATSDGPIISWRVGDPRFETEMTRVSSTNVYQESHTITNSMQLNIQDLRILDQVTNVIAKTPCISSIKSSWSLNHLAAVRLKAEVHELAAKDALNKATAIASSTGFTTVVAKEVISKDCESVSSVGSTVYSEIHNQEFLYQTKRGRCRGGWEDFDEDTLPSAKGEVNWTGLNESGGLDSWKLIFTPKDIIMRAELEAKFSATGSTGWVYEEFNEHRFLTT